MPSESVEIRAQQYRVDTETGCWVWTGTITDGYGVISIDGRMWRVHRWAYLRTYGQLPTRLDHICRNRACVNPAHLRPADHAENAQNLTPRSGRHRGVSYDRARRLWRARVVLHGRTHYLGRFPDESAAAAAAAAFRAEHMPYSPDAAQEGTVSCHAGS